MKHALLATLLASIITIGCDDDSVEAAGPPVRLAEPIDAAADGAGAVDFRAGPPWLKYLPYVVSFEDFHKMLWACTITKPLTVSLSGYHDPSTELEVMGFGFSMMADAGLRDCMIDMMDAQGAVDG